MKTNSSQTSKKKLNYSTIFFVNQCPFLSNNCAFPTDLPQLTNKCLNSIHFSSSDNAKTISHLDLNNTYGIRIIKLWGNSICKRLSIIFNHCLNEGKFPHEWKKANVVPVHKKTNRVWKTIGLSFYSLFTAKFSSVLFTTKCLLFLLRTIWSLQINQDLNLGTLVLTNYLLLPTKFLNCLMKGLKSEGFS